MEHKIESTVSLGKRTTDPTVTPREELPVGVPGYAIGPRIGAGGFGEVYRARHELMGRDVAIKILHAKYSSDPAAVSRFLAEARAVARLSHSSIVDVFDFGQLDDGRQYCVMELLHGRTLREILRERTRLPLGEALPILSAIAAAIDAAHAASVAHRDLKPENVFVTDSGVKLIDFGLAKLTSEDAVRITTTGTVFGTPLYMSPEQCRGRGVTAATDAYSFGALAYHVLVGEPPFTGDALELALHHLNDDPVPPSKRVDGLDERVDRVVLALMAKEPADRPSSLAAAIAAIGGEGELPARRRRRVRVRWLAVAGVTLALGVTAFELRPATTVESASCQAAGDRLTGVWDAAVRDKTTAHFASAHRPDVDATWRQVSSELDGFATEWSRQWTAACRSDDRKNDPLLYGQRLTCLDNALLQFRGIAAGTAESEPVAFSEGFFGSSLLPALADCESTPILRLQAPAPPPAQRDKIASLVTDVVRAGLTVRTAFAANRPELLEPALAKVRETTKQLDSLGTPAAAIAWWILAWQEVLVAQGDRDRLADSEAAIDTAIRRVSELHVDSWLPMLYITKMDLASMAGDSAKLDAAFAATKDAIERDGRPARAVAFYAKRQFAHDLDAKQFEAARADLDRHKAVCEAAWAPAEVMCDPMQDGDAAALELAMGHLEAAENMRRQIVARVEQVWSADHRKTVQARQALWEVLQREQKHAEARDVVRALAATEERVGAAPNDIGYFYAQLIRESVLLGDFQTADSDMSKLTALLEQHPDLQVINQAAADMLTAGELEVSDYFVSRGNAALAHRPAPERASLEQLTAYLAMARGDYETTAAAARRALALTPDGAGADVQLAFADAKAGRTAAARAHLPFKPPPEPDGSKAQRALADAAGHTNDGLVYSALGDWSHAIAAFRASLDLTRPLHLRDWNIAEPEAWLGDALVASGDPRAAIEPLEDSLAITSDCCHGFHYFAPMAEFALARALWATDGDHARARKLAERARDHYARLGSHRDGDRHAVEAWLAAHR